MQFEYLGLTKEPFAEQPDIELFFPEAGRTTLLRRVYADLQTGSAVLRIIGSEGTGKTMLCQMLVHLLPDEFHPVFLTEPGDSFDELCQSIFLQLDGEPNQETVTDLPALAEHYQGQGKQLLLLIDQAEKMFPAALERLSRIAFAAKGSSSFFQVILAGQPVLNEGINQLTSYCADIDIPTGYTVAALTEEETRAYLNFRLKAAGLSTAAIGQAFSQEAVRKIFTQTQGNLRQINQLAAQALQKLCEGKRQLPVQKTDVPIIKEAGVLKKAESKSWRLIKLSAIAVLFLLTGLLFHYNSALWQNGLDQVQHLFNFGPTEPKKLLPLPKEFQLNSEEDLPPATETQPEEAGANQSSESEPLVTEEKQEIAEASDEVASAEKIVPATVVETTEEAAPPIEQESPTEEVLPEESLDTPAAQIKEDEPKEQPTIQELTPVSQKKIVQLVPSMKKTKVAPVPEKKDQKEQKKVEIVPEQQQVPTINIPSSIAEPAPDANMLYQELHVAGSRLRTSVNANKYTLQLLVLSSPDAASKIKEMIVRDEYLDYKQQLKILRKQTLPTALFIFYGLYDSADEAKRALDNLPLFLRKHHPYVLPVKEALKKTAYLY